MSDPVVALPFHRRYRPHTFQDLVGQPMVKAVVEGALATGQLSGCFLFHGAHGVGKTSLMRLTAAAVLCTEKAGPTDPCGKCASCLEVFSGSEDALDYREHDAGNETGADAARMLVGWLNQHPARGKRRIVAIDEVHKLSNAASSVLLKLVEEPPAHVLFLMATTDPEKVLPTIRSRSISLQLRPLTVDVVSDRLAFVAKEEGVKAGVEVLREVAGSTGGHMRDALQVLQRLSLLGRPVTLDDLWAFSSKLPPRHAGRLAKVLLDGDAVAVLEQVRELQADGLLADQVVLGMEQLFRDCFLLSQTKGADHLVFLPPDLLPKFKALAGLRLPTVWRQLLAITELTVKRMQVHAGREALLVDVWALELLPVASGVEGVSVPSVGSSASTPRPAAPAVSTVRTTAEVDPPEIPTGPAPEAVVPVIDSDRAALVSCLRNRNQQGALKQASGFEVLSDRVRVQPSSERHRQVLITASEEIAEAFTALLQRPIQLEVV
jgi:DNA polymerase-3 subunit gamma/tau